MFKLVHISDTRQCFCMIITSITGCWQLCFDCRLFICLCVNSIAQSCGWILIYGTGRLWTREELIKFWNVRIMVIAYAAHIVSISVRHGSGFALC